MGSIGFETSGFPAKVPTHYKHTHNVKSIWCTLILYIRQWVLDIFLTLAITDDSSQVGHDQHEAVLLLISAQSDGFDYTINGNFD